jgi:hypothetical protein
MVDSLKLRCIDKAQFFLDDGKSPTTLHFQCEGMDCSRIRQCQAIISITYTEYWAVVHDISQFSLKDPPGRRCGLDERPRAGAARSAASSNAIW